MITRRYLVAMGVAYTAIVAVTIAVLIDPPAVPVFGVAVAWFSIGRAWDRLPVSSRPFRPRWGRQ